MGCLGLYFRFLLEFSFQDITWQDEHSAPFSWETRVSWIKFRFACPFKKNCIVTYFSSDGLRRQQPRTGGNREEGEGAGDGLAELCGCLGEALLGQQAQPVWRSPSGACPRPPALSALVGLLHKAEL